MEHIRSQYEVINLGNTIKAPLTRIIQELKKCLSVRAILEYHNDQLGYVPLTLADIRRALKYLGYQPKVPFTEGLATPCDWLTGHSTPFCDLGTE